jgi:hypothetical protein
MGVLRDELVALVAPLGLDRVPEALRDFLVEPDGFAEALRLRLVAQLIAAGEAALHARRPARALALFNRVLALDEDNARVQAHLERMRRRRSLQRRLRIVAVGVLTLASLAAAGMALRAGLSDVPPPVLGAPPAEPAAGVPPAEPPAGVPGVVAPAEGPADFGVAEPAPAGTPAEIAAATAGEPPVASARPRPEPVAATPVAGPREEPAAPREPPPTAPARMQKVQLRWVPQGATLYIDGNRVDTVAPAWSGELPAGAHTFALTHPACCRPWEEQIVLDGDGGGLRRSIAMAPQESGWFEVESDQADAEVWFEGTFKGTVAQVNARGGVPVAFSKDDPGRDRYVKTVRFQLLPPRGNDSLAASAGEVVVRAGQKARSALIRLEARDP